MTALSTNGPFLYLEVLDDDALMLVLDGRLGQSQLVDD